MPNALLKFDREKLQGIDGLVGVDEAGRGAFAGPVVAAGVLLSPDFYKTAGRLKAIKRVNDSKQLPAEERSELFEIFSNWADAGKITYAVGEGSVEEIEDFNILGATRLAMTRVLETLNKHVTLEEDSGMPLWDLTSSDTDSYPNVLVDGLPLKPFKYTHNAIVEGDGKSLAIAMASIIAKVHRDRTMIALAETYPKYGFDSHKGYGTPPHQRAILKHGTLPIHRKKFIRNVLKNT